MARKVIVVGAGSAGCIVAARLTEDPDTSVVLLEAGVDYPDVRAAPDDIRSGFVMGGTGHDWGYLSEPMGEQAAVVTPGSAMGVVPVLRGKVVGGSSAVNGTAIRRPQPTDFGRWVTAGNEAWSWEQVLPAFRDLEDDPSAGAWHGQGGPLPIHRFPPGEMRPVQRAFLEACAKQGYPLIDDHNAPGSIGAGPIPLNQRDGIRQSTSVTHLSRARGRPNFTLRSEVTVDRIELDGGRPRVVVLTDGDRVEGDLVVLAAGAYGSPAILLRSGIGAAGELRAINIKPVVDLPAVGHNLRDHPMLAMSFEGDIGALGALSPPVQTLLTFASDGSLEPSHVDLEACLTTPCAPSEWFSAPLGTVVVGVGLVKPHSTGRVGLASPDPLTPPRIWLNFFTESSDLERMVYGVGVVRELLGTPVMKPFVGGEQFPGAEVSHDALRSVVQTSTPSYAHATGTCQMGPDAETAVVDQRGRVHLVDDLWVIDASIMPALPSAPTNLTTMMLAERCVQWLKKA